MPRYYNDFFGNTDRIVDDDLVRQREGVTVRRPNQKSENNKSTDASLQAVANPRSCMPRECKLCGHKKPANKFYAKGKTRRDCVCMECRRAERNARYRKTNTTPQDRRQPLRAPAPVATTISLTPAESTLSGDDFAHVVKLFQMLRTWRDSG